MRLARPPSTAMTHEPHDPHDPTCTLWIYAQPDGLWAGHYVDRYGALDIVCDGASPEAVEAAVVEGLGVQPASIRIEPPSPGEPPALSEGKPLSQAYERLMLAKADRHIAAARERIHCQEHRVATLERDGHDTAQGRELLEAFKATLQAMVEHRQVILEQIERLEQRDRSGDSRAQK
jgi:hypothetical protein